MSLQPTFYKNRKFPSMKDSQPPKSDLLPGFPGFDPPGYIPQNWGQIGTERDHGAPRNGAGLGSGWGQSNQDKEPGSPINGARLRPGWGQPETERDPGAPRKPPRTPRFNQNRYSPSRELFTQMRETLDAIEAAEAAVTSAKGGADKISGRKDFSALGYRKK